MRLLPNGEWILIAFALTVNAYANPLSNSELKDPALAANSATLYRQNCSHCHSGNAPSAPRIGDSQEWAKRLAHGFNHLYQSAINGISNSAMIAKGGHNELSDEEVKSIVRYMLNEAKLDDPVIQSAIKYDAFQITDPEFIQLDTNYQGYLEKNNLLKTSVFFSKFEEFDKDRNQKMTENEFLAMKGYLGNLQKSSKVTDANLQKNILTELSKISGMPSSGIRVNVKNGYVVINGVVGDGEVLERAWQAVRWLPGLQKIDNRLMTAEMMAFD